MELITFLNFANAFDSKWTENIFITKMRAVLFTLN